jgi:hypothetical protein
MKQRLYWFSALVVVLAALITFAVPLGTSDSIPYTDVLTGTISAGF